MDPLKVFEERFDTVLQHSKLSRSDPFVWSELLSNDYFSTYMPAEFVWKYRYQHWNWDLISKKYKIGSFFRAYRNENWSYKTMLDNYHNKRVCDCAKWLH